MNGMLLTGVKRKKKINRFRFGECIIQHPVPLEAEAKKALEEGNYSIDLV